MSDAIHIHQEIAEYSLPRPKPFKDLSRAKDFIRELRQKHACYHAIADLLTRHQFPIGKTCVSDFCHTIQSSVRRIFRAVAGQHSRSGPRSCR